MMTTRIPDLSFRLAEQQLAAAWETSSGWSAVTVHRSAGAQPCG